MSSGHDLFTAADSKEIVVPAGGLLLPQAVSPKRGRSTFRITFCSDTDTKLSLVGWMASIEPFFKSGLDIVAGEFYTAVFSVENAMELNFRATAIGANARLLVEEVSGGVI